MNHELPPQFLPGVALFNAGQFFECHEVLEELWLASNGDERTLLPALIQAAAALHHWQNGNTKGAASIDARARRKLESLPPHLMRLDTHDFCPAAGSALCAGSVHRRPCGMAAKQAGKSGANTRNI